MLSEWVKIQCVRYPAALNSGAVVVCRLVVRGKGAEGDWERGNHELREGHEWGRNWLGAIEGRVLDDSGALRHSRPSVF